jgi:pheromone shutdown protein TraB
MNNREKLNIDNKEWRRLCQLVAVEPDPQRLSELLDQLLKELDARREALRESER